MSAEARDGADALARFRDEFAFEQGGPLYVDGNSLGRLPRRYTSYADVREALQRLHRVVEREEYREVDASLTRVT
jgi:hypothetical protein